MSYDIYLDFHNPSKIFHFWCFSDLVQGMEDLIKLKRRKLELEERKVHALERIATVLENQQINQHSPPLSIYSVIKLHENWRLMWAFLWKFVLCLFLYTFHIFVFFSRTIEPYSITFGTRHHLVKGIQVCSNN